MSKIVQAGIGPIKASKLKVIGLSSINNADKGKVDPGHPITKAMMAQLPRVSDEDLIALKKYITQRDVAATGQSLQDIESWLHMINEEINYRATERHDLLNVLINQLSSGG